MFPQFVDNETEAVRTGTCTLPCGCTSECMTQQPPMQSRVDWGLRAAHEGFDALLELQSMYGMFPGMIVARLESTGYAQQCCDHLWMPPIRFVNADAVCDVNYRLFIGRCSGNVSTSDILDQEDAPIIEKHCSAQNLQEHNVVLGWAVHWEGVMSMRV